MQNSAERLRALRLTPWGLMIRFSNFGPGCCSASGHRFSQEYDAMNSPSLFSLRLASLLVFGFSVAILGLQAQEPLPNHLSKRVVGDYGYWSKFQTPAYGAAQIPY